MRETNEFVNLNYESRFTFSRISHGIKTIFPKAPGCMIAS